MLALHSISGVAISAVRLIVTSDTDVSGIIGRKKKVHDDEEEIIFMAAAVLPQIIGREP